MLGRVLIDSFGTLVLILTIFLSGGNSLIIGTVLAVIIFLIGNISGAYVNPAVAFAEYMFGSLQLTELLAYSLGHFIAAIIAVKLYSYVKT